MQSTSDKYSKYIVKIKRENKNSFLIFGRDELDTNILLIDKDNKILLFYNVGTMIKYILSTSELPDKNSFHEWATKINPNEVDSFLDIDEITKHVYEINKNVLSDLNKEMFNDTVNIIHLISDYAYQTNNLKLIELYENETIDAFVDIHAGNYLWRIKDDEKVTTSINLTLFKNIFEQMLSIFNASLLFYEEK
jgi:hypothetical protein